MKLVAKTCSAKVVFVTHRDIEIARYIALATATGTKQPAINFSTAVITTTLR